MTTDIHTCSYHCTRPECVLAQRDELRDKLVGLVNARVYRATKNGVVRTEVGEFRPNQLVRIVPMTKGE